jgi:S1-C subfamily serine protease
MSEQPGHGSAGASSTLGHGFSAISAGPGHTRDEGAGADGLDSTGPAPATGDGQRTSEFASAVPAQTGRDGERTSEFGRFDWFAELDNFGRGSGASDSRALNGCQPGNGQLPGNGKPPADGQDAVDGQTAFGHAAADGAAASPNGSAKRAWWRPSSWPPARWLHSARRHSARRHSARRYSARLPWIRLHSVRLHSVRLHSVRVHSVRVHSVGRHRSERDASQTDGSQRPGGRGRFLRGWRLGLAAFVFAVACTLLGGVMGGFVALHSEGNGLSDSSYSLGSVPPALTDRPASSVAGIAARDTPGVVMIKVNGGEGTGSGFLIKGGYIITDNHVVTLDGLLTGASLRVYFSDGKSAKGVLVGRDPYSDIAVLKAQGVTKLPALTLGNSGSVAVGDPVIAIGSPLGLADTVTSGIVSAVDRPVQPAATNGNAPQVFFDAIQTDAPINPGNSGGPLVNARGQVIGVDAAIDTLGNDPITGTQGGSIGLGFAIPMDQARRVVTELIRTGHATHSVFGAAFNETFTGTGAQIMTGHTAVVRGGPAARAGLEPGDVITEVGSQEISNAYAVLDAIRSLAPGSHIPVTFLRQGQTRQTELTLGSASS